MKRNNNIIFWLLLSLYAPCSADTSGHTKLTQSVIDSEYHIKIIQEDERRLWHECYEYGEVVDGQVTKKLDNNTLLTSNIYKTVLRRRVSCLDSDIVAHKQCLQDLWKEKQNAISNIRRIVKEDSSCVACQDNFGKTALNYCYTPEIYDELIRQGVPFQWKVWAYFKPEQASLLALGIVGAGVLGYNYFSHK